MLVKNVLMDLIINYDISCSKYLYYNNPRNLKWRKFLKFSEFSCHCLPWLIASIALTYIWPQEKLIKNILIGLSLHIIIIAIVKACSRRLRPFYKKSNKVDKNSFPSGHSAWAMYLCQLFNEPLLAIWLFFVSLSRVLNGQNYVGDVLAGNVFGLLIYKLQFSFCNGIINEIAKWCLSFILSDNDDYDDDFIRS